MVLVNNFIPQSAEYGAEEFGLDAVPTPCGNGDLAGAYVISFATRGGDRVLQRYMVPKMNPEVCLRRAMIWPWPRGGGN